MQEYGIYSEAAGGFIETQMWSESEAQQRLPVWIEYGEDADDLKVIALCPDHEEQPREGCEECEADDEADDDDSMVCSACREHGHLSVDCPHWGDEQ